MAGDELPEPVAEKTASHEAIDLQAINSSISTENLKEQMETKSNVLNVNIVNEDGDIVKEEVPYKLGISEQNPECLEKSNVNLEQEVPKNEENSSRIEKPNAEEQDKVNGETENELHSTQFSEELSPEVVKGDGIPPNGIPLLLEEVQEKTNSEEVTEKVHHNQISVEDETEKDANQSSSVATLSENDNQKELEIPIGIASKNPEDVSNDLDVPSSTTPLVADEVLEEPNEKNDVSEEAQEEQIHQIETPKEDLAEEKECRDETEDQCKDVPLAASLEETILEETSEENQTPEMSCEEIEQNEETTLINKMDVTSRIDNEETIPDEVSTSYDRSTANEETRKRDEGSEHMSADIKVDDVAETATPLILEVAKGSADIKEDATEKAHKNQISNEVGTEKDASQSTSVIELSESDDKNETVKAIENKSTNLEEEDTKELDLKEDESPSSVQDEILEEAKETIDIVELQNEQRFEEVKPTQDNIAMGEKEETMQNQNEENAEDLTSSCQDITNEETGKTNGETEHIADESTLETVTTRDFAPEIDIKDAEIKTLTSETDNRDIEKIEEENEEISVEVGPSESSDAPMKIEEVSLNKCKEEKSEEHEKLEHQEIDEGQEAESCLEIKEQLDESKPSPSEEEKNTVETKPLNETEEGEDNLAQSEIPSESKEKNSEDEEETCDEKSVEVSEIPIHEENDVNKDTDGDQLVEVKGPDDEAVKGNKVEIPESTEASNDTGALIDTQIASEKVELQSENTFSSQLTTSEEVLPEVPSESTTISEMEKVDKSNEVLDSKTENMEIESSHDDDPNKNSEAAGSAEVTEAPKEDLQDRTSEGSYEQGQVVPEKQTDEADLTISTYGNEIETEKPEIANASSQGQEENSVIPQKDDESVLEVQPEEETKAETLEILLLEKATEEDSLTIASKDNEIETEKPETGEPFIQGQDDKSVILNDAESVLEVKPEEDTNVEILETEKITQTLEEVDEPCITQNKEVLPEAENEIKSKETSTNSSISTIQQEQQSEETDAKPTEAYQTTYNISEEEGMETNATLISGIEQIDERSIAKEEEVTIQVENTVVETPDEETKRETEKQIEEIPQITASSEVTEVELGQSKTVAPVTENFEVVSNEKSSDDIKFTDLDTKSAELGSPTDESLAQKDTSIETSNAREFQIDSAGFTSERDQANQESDVKLTIPDQAADEVFAVKNLEDNAKLSETVEQIGDVDGLVANNGKDINKIIPQNDDGLESEVKAEKETIDETQTNEEIAQKLEEVNEESCITQNKEELPEAENTTENKETSTDSSISTLLGDQQSEKSDVKPRDAKQATDAISEEECLEINATLTSSLEEINERSIANEEEITKQEENNVVETIKEETEGESAGNQIEQIPEMTDPSEVTQVERESDIVAPETEKLEAIPNEKLGEESEVTDAHSKSSELESTIDELIERKETCVEQIDEREIMKEQEATIQEHNIIVETQKGEADGESTEEKMEEIPEITGSRDITEIEISEGETIAPETENVEVVSNKKFDDESKSTETDAKSVGLESTTGESTEQKEISTEPSNTREAQIETENITVPDQLSQESDVKPTEVDQVTNEVSAVIISEDAGILSSSAEQIGEVKESIPKEESVNLQEEDDVVAKVPEEEAEKIEAANENKMEDENAQVTNPSEVTEVELSQSEFGAETELIDTYSKSAELESATDKSTEQNESSTELIHTREVQIDQTKITTEQDQLNQVSDTKPTEPDQDIDKVSEEENSEVNATLSTTIEQTGDVEELVANKESVALEAVVVEIPEEEADEKVEATYEKHIEEIPEMTDPSEVTKVERESEIVAPETEILEVVPNEKFVEEKEPTDAQPKSSVLESTIDELIERKETCVEQIDERAIMKEQEATIQEQNIIVETQKGEADGESTEEKMEEIPEITGSRDITEIEISEGETVAPETENVEVVSNQKFDDESKSTETDAKSAGLESTTGESTEQKEISTEPSNTREAQIETENTVPDQLSQESDVKPTEVDQVTDEVFAVIISEDTGILSSSAEQIGEVKESISKEESVNLQEEDDVVAKMSEEEAEKTEVANENQMEEEVTNSSEVTEVELSQSEFVAPETENMKDEKLDAEIELTDTFSKSAELKIAIDESSKQNEISTEPIHTREVQIDQTEITTEQGHLNKESVVLQEDVAVKLPEDEEDQNVEATNEKHIEEVPQIVRSGEVTEDQLVDSEPVGREAEHLETISDQKFEGKSELGETDLGSDQMETVVEKTIADLRSEENEGFLKVQEEKTDTIEVVGEPIDKHIDGEFHRTPDSEIYDTTDDVLKTILTEKEVNIPIFETQAKLPEQEKETEESVLVEEKSDTVTLVSGEGKIEETESADKESGVLPQSTTELPEQKVSQGFGTPEEPSDKDIAGEISKIIHPNEITEVQLVEGETLHSETEKSEFISNETLGDENKLDETVVKLAQMGSTSDELIEEKFDANLSSSGEKICEKSEESEVVLQSTDELVQGEKIDAEVPKEETSEGIEIAEDPGDKHIGEKPDAEMLKEEGSQGNEVAEDSCDKHIEKEIHRAGDPEICYAAEELKDILIKEEVDNIETGTESTEKTTEESSSVEEKSDATASLIPDEEHIKVESANRESNVVSQSTTELVAVPEERVPLENDTGAISKIADLETHDGVIQSEIILSEEKVDSEELRTEIESPDLENATKESALVEEKLNSAANLVHGEEKIEEVETASKESRVSPQNTIESVTGPKENVSEGIETSEEQRDKHIVKEDQEVIEQTERDVDVTELLKTVEKVAVDETNEDSRETMPNLSEQSKEVEDEAKQSEVPEQDFASIVSSFLISKVLSDENQKVDDDMKQNNDASSIPKPLDGETIQELVTTKTETETGYEEVLYGTSPREEAKLQIQEPEEENGEKTVEENGEEDGVEHDYLPVSRFLMDKILQQEGNKNIQEEKAIEETDKHPVNDSEVQVEEKIEETDKDLVNDGGTQVEKKIEENSHIVLAPEQKDEMTSSFNELPRDFDKGETLMGKVESTFAGDGVLFIKEKVEENTAVAELTKLEGEGSHSPIEVASDFEKKEKLADAPKPIEDKNETLVGDVGISSVEKDEGENSSDVVVAEQEGESISPIEAIHDFENENKSMEQKNEALITDERISSIEKIEENTSDVALHKQEKTLYSGEVVRDFDKDKKPVEEKDDTMVCFDEVKEGGNSKVALEEAEDLSYREHSKDLIEGALMNVHEISNPKEVSEENRIVGMHKGEEHKKEVIVDEETPKDVKNVEENYVFVEHEANQFEEPKAILEEEKATDEASGATISNLEKKETNLSFGIQNEKTNLVGQIESSEKSMKNSSVGCQGIEQHPSNIPKVPMDTEIVKELVGNETEFIHGEERVKEVTDTMVDNSANRSQEKHAEIDNTIIEKKGEDIKSEEHEEEEEDKEEESHQERETEIIGRDLTVKAEARETEMKSAQKKSHNILSGVGSKVKHSFAKVKKAITGKSKNVSPSAK